MLVTEAGRILGVKTTDTYEKIHDRVWEHFSTREGFWRVLVIVTSEFTDAYVIFHTERARDAALLSAPAGFSRGPSTTIFAEILIELFGEEGKDVQ